ncbi:MAG TPA: hypothetical protein DIC36_03375, partial [Gammaproteobacteria bacterium]|nr:hypothetical protein [Gammaproteobacteria bacterium]
MKNQTAIEWTHLPGYQGRVWNPNTGCQKVSQGCKHCYAERWHNRFQKNIPFSTAQLLEY